MTSDAAAALGAAREPIGDFLGGRLLADRCVPCGHPHRYPANSQGSDVEFDAACPLCPCTSSGAEYDGTVVRLDDYKHRPFGRHAHDGPLCAVHGLPGICVECPWGKPRGSGRVAANGDLRRGRPRRPEFRVLRHLSKFVAGVRRWTVRADGWRGDTSGASSDRDGNRGASA